MRIAVLIISLCLTMLVGVQSCTVMVGGNVTEDANLSGGGAIGMLLALLFVLGAAFSMGLPRVSMVLFAIGAVLGIGVAGSSGFNDLMIWGVVSAALAVMSFFGNRELRRKRDAKQSA